MNGGGGEGGAWNAGMLESETTEIEKIKLLSTATQDVETLRVTLYEETWVGKTRANVSEGPR